MNSTGFQEGASQAPFGRAPVAMMGQSNRFTSSSRPSSSEFQRSSSIQRGVDLGVREPRVLPSRDTNAETIEDDYVRFIFYCNPTLSLDVDTTELRKGFLSMPKTDGKTFDIFTLFELIRKWESKEIETWSQLVIDMGVVPPDVASGQSTQKVQQYAVRLKRWLHAYHIDAFFQYCLGRPNTYYTQIPVDNDASMTTMRDGVALEEDLALRALVPTLRPKRGRKPNDESTSSPLVKRQLRSASLTAEERSASNPMSAHPQSASPWDRESNQRDVWAAAHRAIAPDSHRTTAPAQHPSIDNGQMGFYMDLQDASAHPQSAINSRTPNSAFPTSAQTPQSAYPDSARPRKRHGPSVSAAWASDHSPGGKLRGRPPTNRTVQDGPFSTFPVKQTLPPSGLSTPISGISGSMQTGMAPRSMRPSPPAPIRKPSKLQLQVPQHSGAPVRLATPPPKVLLNGFEDGDRHCHKGRTSIDFFNAIDEDTSERGESEDEGRDIDWKKRAIVLQRKVQELECELKSVKRRVLEAVM